MSFDLRIRQSVAAANVEEAGAPGTEIDVTPEMIEAGVCVLWESGAVENPNEDADRSLVQKIFVAMYLRSRERRLK